MIIFLDIDGVLNCLGEHAVFPWVSELNHKNWNKTSLNALNLLVKSTEAKIVISSSWRKIEEADGRPEWFQDQFKLAGYDFEVVGLTPSSHNGFRGREVNMWIDDNGWSGRYLIIDDDSDFYQYQPRIHTRNKFGLTENDVVNYLWLGAREDLDCMPERNPL